MKFVGRLTSVHKVQCLVISLRQTENYKMDSHEKEGKSHAKSDDSLKTDIGTTGRGQDDNENVNFSFSDL